MFMLPSQSFHNHHKFYENVCDLKAKFALIYNDILQFMRNNSNAKI